MLTITISRGGGLADRFLAYGIIIDGEHRGTIRAKQRHDLEVSPGSHHVQLRVGMLYGFPMIRIHVDARGLALACGSNKNLSAAIFQMARLDTWIWIEALPSA